jgi:thioredoxin reductase
MKTENGFQVQVASSEKFTARKLVFASGIKDIMQDIPGYAECWGISVLHCPYCHGYEVSNQQTGILGNGEYGYEFASLIANWTNDLTLYTNGKSTLTTEQILKLQKHNINIQEAEIKQLKYTNGYIQTIIFKNGNSVPIKVLYARSSFVQHCAITEELGCELSEDGYTKVDPTQKTSVQGVFACGDNTTRIRTVANAVAMGTTTGITVNKALIEDDF